MARKIVIAIVVLLGALLIFAASKPDTLLVRRTIDIKATPEKIFAQINNFHNWLSWSPWEKVDPNMKRNYSGTPSGKGAIYEWEGNNEVGKGRMEITDSVPTILIAIKLDFIKPFEGHDIAEFVLIPKGDFTNVTWSMHGPNSYLAKVIQVFINMDSMIGKNFEDGLAHLKAIAER